MSTRPRWLAEAARSKTTQEPSTLVRPTATLKSQVRSTHDRFDERARRARRARTWPRLLLTVGVAIVLLVTAVVWLVAWSPVLTAREVAVNGLSNPAETQAVAAAAAIPLGVPLVKIDTSGAAARVAKIPTVASVTVTRSWPSTVTVQVERKVAVLGVQNPQGQLQVVDARGIPFEAVSALPPGIAQVNATSSAPDPAGLRAAIEVLQVLSPAQRSTVSALTVTSADLVTLQLGAVSVVWGGSDDGAKKLAVLNALLRTNPAVIDVSAPDTPVTR